MKASFEKLSLCVGPAELHLCIFMLATTVEMIAFNNTKFAFPPHDIFQLLITHDAKLAAWIAKELSYFSASGVS